jgi:uncharacterized membrane protein
MSFETAFQALFKYRPVVFSRGHFAFGAAWPTWLVAALVVAAAALAAVGYVRLRGQVGPRARIVLGAARFVVIMLLLFCLARPMLVVATVVPQQNYLGILIDDSRSMGIKDGDTTRAAVATDLLKADHPLIRALAQKFKLRFFRFSDGAAPASGVEQLAFQGRHTDLGGALDEARRELAAVPLAGLVAVTDGADNAGAIGETLERLKAARVPVSVVGVGRERFTKDLELTRVEVPRTVLKGATVAADLGLTQAGFGGERATVDIEDGGRLVASREIRLPREGEAATVRIYFTLKDRGARRLKFRVRPQPGELIAENNERASLIQVDDRSQRILYFEGEPRWEVKFLRRAVAGDSSLHLVTLLRTSENKFLRLDVGDSTEVSAGFPKTRPELYRYRGLILGNVEASFFTHDQLRMIADFVSQRGGGLLTLGGREALGEGGFADSPVAEALPVVLKGGTRSSTDSTGFFSELKVELTPAGRSHPMLQLASEPDRSEQRWSTLPFLSTVNDITAVKPGASALLVGRAEGRREPFVVLAAQRYGRGRAMTLAVQDLWRWRMDATMPVTDLTLETLWRQQLRWLVSDVPDRVSVTTSAERTEPGRAVTLTAQVGDSAYLALNGARVTATITSPSGVAVPAPLEWSVARDGEYRGTFTPTEDGVYAIRVDAQQGRAALGSTTTHVEVGDMNTEHFGAEMQAGLLKRVASETGGRFYTPATVASLPEDVSFTESGTTVREERSLWDMPIVFLLFLGLVGGEWAYRRKRGLP